MRKNTNTHKIQTNRFRRESEFKKRKACGAPCYPVNPIPPLRIKKRKDERQTAELGFTSTSQLPSLRGESSEALSTPHKEKRNVKEDYKKKEGMFKGEKKKTSGRAFCVWHSGQTQLVFSQWENISTSPLRPTLFAVVASHKREDCFTPYWQ